MSGGIFHCRGLWFPANELHMQQHLDDDLLDGKPTYQGRKFAAALRFVSPERRGLAVDVGAHVGLWTRQMLAHFDRVVAYEPIKDHRQCWFLNIEDPRASMIPVGLADVPSSGWISLGGGNTGATYIVPDHLSPPTEGATWVRLEPMDESCLRGVCFLKIDCEGAEELVVRGGAATIQRDRPVIIVEQKPGHAERLGLQPMGAVRLLESWGAQVLESIKGDFIMGWPE